jgi:hypothetical protein
MLCVGSCMYTSLHLRKVHDDFVAGMYNEDLDACWEWGTG